MKKTAFITGVAGQDGSYLAGFLLRKGYYVVGLIFSSARRDLWRLDYFKIKEKIKLIAGDVADTALMERLIRNFKPHELYNLAGHASVARSWENPAETFRVNATAVIALLDIVRCVSPKTRFFQASSAEIYGNIRNRITEKTDSYNPLHPYGIAKLAAHTAVKNFRSQYGLFAVNGILFNHESVLRDNHFVTKKIVKGVIDIIQGRTKELQLGNIAACRDFAFAGDVVVAMWRMLRHIRAVDFVICTGKNYAIKDFIREAFAYVGIQNWQRYIQIDSSLVRKYDVRDMRGLNAKIKKELGWQPTINFKQLVHMMVDYEMEHVQKTL